MENGAATMPSGSRCVQDEVAVVTGAGWGIGRATAILLASEGANVVAADIASEATRSCVEEIAGQGGKATAIVLDVANEGSWKSAIGTVVEQLGRLNILVNNAGISISKAAAESSLH
jgi:NAD(P)-dependent dehydrogenase (short-subunit alcohol dehydrogenase family)